MNETMNFCFVNKYLQFLAGNWNKNKKIKKIILGYHFQQGIVKINERERKKRKEFGKRATIWCEKQTKILFLNEKSTQKNKKKKYAKQKVNELKNKKKNVYKKTLNIKQ